MAAVVANGTASALVILGQAVLLASIVSDVFRDGQDLDDIRARLLLLMATFLIRALLSWTRQVLSMRAAATVKRTLRRSLMSAVLRHSPATLGAGGRTAVTAIHGIDALDVYFGRYLPELVLGAVVPLVGIAWIAFIDGLSALILLVTVPLIPVFMVLIGDLADRQTQRRWHRLQSLGGEFQEMVRGMTTLRVFGRAGAWLERLRNSSDVLRRETMATLRIAFLSALVLELLATIGTALVAVVIGLRVVYSHIDFEPAFAVLIMAPEVYLPMRRVGAEFHAAMDGVKASSSVFALIDAAETEKGTETAPPIGNAVIRVTDVSVAVDDRVVLAGVSLEVRPGEFIAITGESGAGKTTLLRLLMGSITPDTGRVTIADCDLSRIAEQAWLPQISYLPQEPFLRSGSIRANLLLADAAAADDRLWDALERCDLADFVSSLPDGLDTDIGESGRRLSAGQRRLLAFARILVRDAPLILLDEPTANVDAATRMTLTRILQDLATSHTVVAVLHDPDIAAVAGRIVEVESA